MQTTFPSGGALRRLLGLGCLVAPLVAVLWVPFYAGASPAFLGLPFFYWYLLAWALVSPGLLAVARLALRPTCNGEVSA